MVDASVVYNYKVKIHINKEVLIGVHCQCGSLPVLFIDNSDRKTPNEVMYCHCHNRHAEPLLAANSSKRTMALKETTTVTFFLIEITFIHNHDGWNL
jgi:hypothetical protein